MLSKMQGISPWILPGLLSILPLAGPGLSARADTTTTIGATGIQYQVDFDFFPAPDLPSGIDPRVKSTA
jgi:hypothetical protein